MKKSNFEFYKNPTMIFSIIAGIGLMGTAIVKLADYITLPERMAMAEEKVETIEDYIKIQRNANDLMQQIITKEKESDPIIFSPDKKKFWNIEKQEWRSVKELESK